MNFGKGYKFTNCVFNSRSSTPIGHRSSTPSGDRSTTSSPTFDGCPPIPRSAFDEHHIPPVEVPSVVPVSISEGAIVKTAAKVDK